MIKRITLLVAVVALSTAVFGQMTFGVKGGLNMTNMKFSASGSSVSNKTLVGYEVGGFANFSINDKMTFQPELLFAQYGCKLDKNLYGTEMTWKMNYISIPLMFKYAMGAINLQAGPQLGYLLSSKVDGNDAMDGMAKLDYGITLRAGYETESGLGLNVGYYFGLANLNDDSTVDMTIKNSGLQVGVSYKFK